MDVQGHADDPIEFMGDITGLCSFSFQILREEVSRVGAAPLAEAF